MKKRNQLTPTEHRHILEQAALLPQMQRLSKSGEPLFRKLARFKGTSNFSESTRSYTKHIEYVMDPVLVNHQVEMISLFEKHGPQAVVDYINKVNEISKRAQAAEAAAAPQREEGKEAQS